MSDNDNKEDSVPLLAGIPVQEHGQEVSTADNEIEFTSAGRNVIFAAFALIFMLYTALSSLHNGSPIRSTLARFGCHHGMGSAATLPAHFKLPSGDRIPAVALGVWQASKGEVGGAVKAALQAGYRHIDGAWAYGNEAEVGQAIKDSGVDRKNIWLTSKLWNSFHAPEDIERVLDESLALLQTSYLDLYLIHWPVAFAKEQCPNGEVILDKDLTENPLPTWLKMEEMVKKGKVRNIGVSNFNIRRYKNLTESAITIKPAVNQVELSFWNPQPELLKWAKEEGVVLEAYSPLGSQDYVKESLNVPEVKEAAAELGVTPAQVLISWHNQRGTVVLPKSVTPSRIRENLKVFALPQKYFDKIEKAASAHPQKRLVNPGPRWGIDVFEDGV